MKEISGKAEKVLKCAEIKPKEEIVYTWISQYWPETSTDFMHKTSIFVITGMKYLF